MKKLALLFTLLYSLSTIHYSPAQSWLWGKMGTGDAYSFSDACDSKGNAYLGCFFYHSDTVHFGNYKVIDSSTTNYDDESFIVKLDQYGNVIWAKQTENINNNPSAITNVPCNISIDGWENIYLSGNFPDTLKVGSIILTDNFSSSWNFTTFIAKYDSNGNVLWAKAAKVINDSGVINGDGIASDTHGNSYITGVFVDTIQFGSYTIAVPSTRILSVFLVKYDSNGNVRWARQSTGHSRYGADCWAVGCDAFGNSIIGGFFDDSITFGSFRLGSNYLPRTAGNMFVTKYDSAGNVLWAQDAMLHSSHSGCSVWALATDNSGNIYVGGNYTDTVTIGGYTINGTQYGNFFLAKLAPNGNVLWVKSALGAGTNGFGVQKLAVDNHNHIYLSAAGGDYNTLCSVNFAGNVLSLTDTAKYDGVSLVYKLDTAGTVLCSSIIVGGAYANCVASDTSGKYVYFGGTTATPMVFGSDTINPFSYRVNPLLGGDNFFPFLARWQSCDTDTVTIVPTEENNITNAKVYPNPNNGAFTLSYQLEKGQRGEFIIYSMFGQEIGKYTLDANSDKMSIVVNNLSNGIYLYSISVDNTIVKRDKMVVIK